MNTGIHQLSIGNKQEYITQQSIQQQRPLENLSFAGCGFLGIYHVGVASCFATYCPQLSMHKIAGSSAGALVATAHICGNVQLARATSDILRVAIKARSRALGPFHPSFNINEIIYDALSRGLPLDAHVRASGRLHVSLTRVRDGENVVINQFDSREDLIQCLICSCFIPFWSGVTPPKLKGEAYIDGGFSDNLLKLDENTITVSPFSGEADICPQDDTFNLLQIIVANTSFSISAGNLYRISHALLPPPPEILSRLCQQGFGDAMRYLQQTNHISCRRCIAIKSSFTVTTTPAEMNVQDTQLDDSDDIDDADDVDDGVGLEMESQEDEEIDIDDPIYGHVHLKSTKCDDCEQRRKLASFDGLPDQFVNVIRDACDQVNKSLVNWIYSHRPIKYLSLAASPCTIPLDITISIVYKMWQQIPNISKECLNTLMNLLKFLESLVVKRKSVHASGGKRVLSSSSNHHLHTHAHGHNLARVSCRMELTEYGYPELLPPQHHPQSVPISSIKTDHSRHPRYPSLMKTSPQRTPSLTSLESRANVAPISTPNNSNSGYTRPKIFADNFDYSVVDPLTKKLPSLETNTNHTITDENTVMDSTRERNAFNIVDSRYDASMHDDLQFVGSDLRQGTNKNRSFSSLNVSLSTQNDIDQNDSQHQQDTASCQSPTRSPRSSRRKISYTPGAPYTSYYQYTPDNYFYQSYGRGRRNFSHDNISMHSAPDHSGHYNLLKNNNQSPVVQYAMSQSSHQRQQQRQKQRTMERRKSTSELRCSRPTRLMTSKMMNFEFTLDVPPSTQSSTLLLSNEKILNNQSLEQSNEPKQLECNYDSFKNNDEASKQAKDDETLPAAAPVIEALCHLNECDDFQGSESDIIDLTNRAIFWENEILHRDQVAENSDIPVDTFDEIVKVTNKQEARVMAYYFLDKKHRLRVTEIYDLEPRT